MKKIREIINKYKTFLKYILSAGISFFIDITLFTIFNLILKNTPLKYTIILATILARIISSLINYNINKNAVFKSNSFSKKTDKTTFIKYVFLVIIQMFVSSFSVQGLYNLTKFNATFIKIPVECILFLVNYFIQKIFIFKKKEKSLEIKIPLYLEKIIYILLSIATSFSLLVKLNSNKILDLSRRDTDALLFAILAIFIYFLQKRYFNKNKNRLSFIILSLIFTLLLIFGYSFDLADSAFLVYGKPQFVLISLVKLIGLFSFFFTAINLIYEKFITLKIEDKKSNKIVKAFNSHPMLFTIIVLLICYLPYIIAFYPAILGYDPANQIKEVMGIHNRYMDSVVLIDPDVTITNFNPVLHTLLLGNCFKLGVNINNVNLGLFLYSIIQITCMILTLGYSIKFLKKEKLPNKLLFVIIGIYALVPIFPFYSLSTNKDTFFTLFIMRYIIKLYELINNKCDKKNLILFILVSVALSLSRNNGIYTILLSLPFCLILKEKRKYIFISWLAILLSYTTYNKVILPYFKITPTSIRETLSVPFQQTAALIKNDEEIISADDKEIIAKILDYDKIKESYDPELSDKVKNTFNRHSSDKDLKSYFNVWLKYLLKRPLTYIDATVNNVYGYFYPNTSKWYLYYDYNTKLKEAGFDYHYNNLKTLRSVLSGYGEAFPYIPFTGLLVNIGANVWVYLFLTVAMIANKNKKMLLILLPALSLILVCMASPANTYFRYAMGYIMTLPLTFALIYKNKNTN